MCTTVQSASKCSLCTAPPLPKPRSGSENVSGDNGRECFCWCKISAADRKVIGSSFHSLFSTRSSAYRSATISKRCRHCSCRLVKIISYLSCYRAVSGSDPNNPVPRRLVAYQARPEASKCLVLHHPFQLLPSPRWKLIASIDDRGGVVERLCILLCLLLLLLLDHKRLIKESTVVRRWPLFVCLYAYLTYESTTQQPAATQVNQQRQHHSSPCRANLQRDLFSSQNRSEKTSDLPANQPRS